MLTPYREQLARDRSLMLTVRARPNARATKLIGILEDGSLKLDVHAVPEDGKANVAVVEFLAQEFDVPKSHVELLSGQQGRAKVIRITR